MKADKTRLYQDVEVLTSITPPRNYQNKESLDKATNYISDEFKKLHFAVTEQVFTASGWPYRNIVAQVKGKSDARIVIGAHYDVCGDQPGADDNASGVAGLLETARLVHEANPELPYTLEFVAYCLEEPPFFATEQMGSAVHAKDLQQQGVKVHAMICYEMIGYFSDEPGSQGFPHPELRKQYPDAGNFIAVVGKQGAEAFTQRVRDLMRSACEVDVQSVNLPEAFGLVGLSDHRNYWKYNIDAVMINDSSFLRNPHYHQRSDTIDTLDFDKMAEVVRGTTAAVLKL